MWYLIVSIPGLCILTHFFKSSCMVLRTWQLRFDAVKAAEIQWETLKNDNIDIYADSLHNAVMTIARVMLKSKQ